MTQFNNKHSHWGTFTVKLDQLGFIDRIFIFVCLMSISVFAFPHLALANTVNSLPMTFDITDQRYLQIGYLPIAEQIANENLPGVHSPKSERLREYLLLKHSPMAEYTDVLLNQYHYRLIIGISFAESNFCKRNIRPHNCWGIGGNSPFTYSSYPIAFEKANDLIQKYYDNGMTTPKLMRSTWVGWQNDNWILAVEMVIRDLEDLGI